MRSFRVSVLFWLAVGLLSLTGIGIAVPQDPLVLRISTSEPQKSNSAKTLAVFAQAMKAKSGGQITVAITYEKDDLAAVEEMSAKERKLDAAFLGDIGLQKIAPELGVFALPGLFPTLAHFDSARDIFKKDADQRLRELGFTFGGWTETGARRLAWKTAGPLVPSTFKGKGFLIPPGDVISDLLAKQLGAEGAEMSEAEVAKKISEGGVEAVLASAPLLERNKWVPGLSCLGENIVNYGNGALVFSSQALQGLNEDQRQLILEIGAIVVNALKKKARVDEEEALKRLGKTVRVVSVASQDEDVWKTVWAGVRKRALDEKRIPPDVLAKIEAVTK